MTNIFLRQTAHRRACRFPRINRVTLIIVAVAVAITFPLAALARSERDDIAGRVVAQVGGEMVELPMLDSAYRVNIEGDMATVELRQTFSNPSQVPLEAEYLFPLNQKAAVFGMTMRVGDEIVQAVIRKKETAEAEYKQAASEGKAAALLTQHRPNMFTQKIANLMPGLPVEVTLKYVQMVPKIDGQYELVVPLIVGHAMRDRSRPHGCGIRFRRASTERHLVDQPAAGLSGCSRA